MNLGSTKQDFKASLGYITSLKLARGIRELELTEEIQAGERRGEGKDWKEA